MAVAIGRSSLRKSSGRQVQHLMRRQLSSHHALDRSDGVRMLLWMSHPGSGSTTGIIPRSYR
jgi:hypothetical protein